MKSDKCSHQVTFVTSLFVTNPYDYPCPRCHQGLTLDKTGRRFVGTTLVLVGLYSGVVGILSILAARQGVPLEQIAAVNLAGLVLGALLLIPIMYIGWKRSRFIERKKLDGIRQTKRRKAAQEDAQEERPPFRYRPIFNLSNS
ncbi:MAG TPA: hypothetical protein VJ952_00965 [Opitutales bacterium]|nr:hypothetical protein [Opitutales bacterium]